MGKEVKLLTWSCKPLPTQAVRVNLMKLFKEDRTAHPGKDLQCWCLERCLWGTDRIFRPENYYNKLLCLYALQWIDRLYLKTVLPPSTKLHVFLYFRQKQRRPSLLATLNHAKYPCKFILISTAVNCNSVIAIVYLPTVSQSNLFCKSALESPLSVMMCDGRTSYKPLVSTWELKELHQKVKLN